jgi:N-acetylglucosamine-6-sulfatase
VKQKGYITDELTDYTIDRLKNDHDSKKAFFIYLSHKAVHVDFTLSKRHEGLYANATRKKPTTEESDKDNRSKPRWLRDQRNS